MYSVLFPGVFLHGVCRWSRMVGMHTCFSIFPSGLLIHGGPHRDPSAGTARAEKFTYLASSFVRLLSAIKSNMWKASALARRTASLLSDYSCAGRGTNKNEWLKAFPGGGPDWAVRGRIAVDELRHGCRNRGFCAESFLMAYNGRNRCPSPCSLCRAQANTELMLAAQRQQVKRTGGHSTLPHAEPKHWQCDSRRAETN